MMYQMMRAAAEILRTDRPLSPEFRKQVAQMVEALSECASNLEMDETVHRRAIHPYYSKGLEMARSACGKSEQHILDKRGSS